MHKPKSILSGLLKRGQPELEAPRTRVERLVERGKFNCAENLLAKPASYVPPTPRHLEDGPLGRRVAHRANVNMLCSLRVRGSGGFTVHVSNISTTGCFVDTKASLLVGEDVWLKMPGLESRLGRVIDSGLDYARIQFDKCLYEPLVEQLVASHPA